MKVHVSDSACVTELVRHLLRGGCMPLVVDETTLELVYPDARDAKEAATDITFFLRAWQSRHPQVEVTLST